MNIFDKSFSKEEKLDCVERMLMKHVLACKLQTESLIDDYSVIGIFCVLRHRGRVTIPILEKLESERKVAVEIHLAHKGSNEKLGFKSYALVNEWDEMIKRVYGNADGLYLSIHVHKGRGKDDSFGFLLTPSELREMLRSELYDMS